MKPPRILPQPDADTRQQILVADMATINPSLTRELQGMDHKGQVQDLHVVEERPMTLFLNGQEIVTMMSVGDYPEFLAQGYLINQGMLKPDDPIVSFDYDEELGLMVVRTAKQTDFENKLKKKTLTSGCAQGTIFGDLMEQIEETVLESDLRLSTKRLVALLSHINQVPSLYLKAGAIHGCALWDISQQGEQALITYFEDIGRHNAVDKTAGYLARYKLDPSRLIFFTTGRLTSEMVIKTVQMGLPILVSRSGFTAWGVSLARESGLTLVGRAKGKRFMVLSGAERLVFSDLESAEK